MVQNVILYHFTLQTFLCFCLNSYRAIHLKSIEGQEQHGKWQPLKSSHNLLSNRKWTQNIVWSSMQFAIPWKSVSCNKWFTDDANQKPLWLLLLSLWNFSCDKLARLNSNVKKPVEFPPLLFIFLYTQKIYYVHVLFLLWNYLYLKMKN